MYHVYILESKVRKRYYVGYTDDLQRRFRQHNSGANKSTKPYIPWKIVYTESFPDKASAWLCERQIKKYKSGEAFRKLISIGGFA